MFSQARTGIHRTPGNKRLRIRLIVAGALAAAGLAAFAAPASAATFEVTRPNDNAGARTLRWAINQANQTAALDTIKFALPGAGPHVIALAGNLPQITQPVTIDGYTQPGAAQGDADTPPVLQVVLDANAATYGLEVAADDSVIRGLVVQDATGFFFADGIRLQGDRNHVEGNFIGTEWNGTLVLGLGNDGDGVHVSGDKNVVGGTGPEDRNVIANNGDAGVRVAGGGSTDNVVAGNLIGTDATGTGSGGNATGVAIGADDNLVGGDTPEEANVIAGNVVGVELDSDDNRVEGNAIGTDATRLADFGNFDGVHITGDNNVVGGGALAQRNLISGNTNGVLVESGTGNAIENNLIGPDGNGGNDMAPLGTAQDGVVIETTNTAIAGNVISNGNYGINLLGDSNTVTRNHIGTNGAGTAAMPNNTGVVISGTSNVIGGPNTESGNLISGNRWGGIEVKHLDGSPAQPLLNQIQGNLVGTAADGRAALPNLDDGIRIKDAGGTLINANVVSANRGHGIRIEGAQGELSSITDNAIGTDHELRRPLGNGGSGVSIDGGNSNTVGSVTFEAANAIAHNGEDGVTVKAGTDNAVVANAYFNNGGLAIDLDDDGATPNDPAVDLDADTGPNDLQNHPDGTWIDRAPAGSWMRWTLDSLPLTDYRIDLYSSPECDATQETEGLQFLTSVTVTTDANGHAARQILLTPQPGHGITATATLLSPQALSTSEMSPCQS